MSFSAYSFVYVVILTGGYDLPEIKAFKTKKDAEKYAIRCEENDIQVDVHRVYVKESLCQR